MTAVSTAPASSASALTAGRPARWATSAIWASWPAGLVLIVGHTIGGLLSTGAFLVVGAAYAGLLGLAICSRGLGRTRRDPVLMVLAGPMVFVLAGLTGPPTALRPGAMLLNAGVLAAAAVILLVAAAGLVIDRGRVDRAAVLCLLGLMVASAGWLLNLVARWAVVLSGGADLQAKVEARAWIADVYLRGLTEPPDFLSFVLVWMDLVQIAYVVLGYVAYALLASVAVRGRLLTRRAGRLISTVGAILAAVVMIASAASAWLEPVQTATAGTAFVLTIPFMSTFLPYLLGAAALGRTALDSPLS